MTEDETKVMVATIDEVMRATEDDAHWDRVLHATLRLGGLVVDASDRDALQLLMQSIPRRPHREAWLTARGILRTRRPGSQQRISAVTASLPLVAQLAVQARAELAEIIVAVAPGALRERLEAVRASVGRLASELYPGR